MNLTDTSVKAVIFDMDGVLVDSEVIAAQIEHEMFAELGAVITVEEIYANFVGLSEASVIRALRRDWNLELPDTFPTDRRARIAERFATDGRAVPGIDAVLRHLSDRQMPLAVASSSVPASIAHKLSMTGLTGWFAGHIYSATMVTNGKPAPDLFEYAARKLDVDPTTCVVIEDSPHGVAAGIAAGMHVIGFTAAGHCGLDHGEVLADAGANRIASNAGELERILDETIPEPG